MRLTVAQAIRSNTFGAAYGIGIGDKTGTIEIGKLAHFIVMDKARSTSIRMTFARPA